MGILEVRTRTIRTTSRSSIPTAPSTPPATCSPGPTRWCTRFRGLGLEKGDTVAAVLPNGAQPVPRSTSPRCRPGFYYVPINYRLSAPEIAYILEDCDAKAFVSTSASPDARRAPRPTRRASRPTHRLAHGAIPGFASFAEVVDAQPTTQARRPLDRRGDALHVGHDRQAQGREARARRHRPRHERRAVHVLVAALRHHAAGAGNVHLSTSPNYHTAVTTFAGNSLHMGHTVVCMDKWDARGDAAPHRALRLHAHAHGADAVHPHAATARRREGEVRRLRR